MAARGAHRRVRGAVDGVVGWRHRGGGDVVKETAQVLAIVLLLGLLGVAAGLYLSIGEFAR